MTFRRAWYYSLSRHGICASGIRAGSIYQTSLNLNLNLSWSRPMILWANAQLVVHPVGVLVWVTLIALFGSQYA